jgi:hypothetical protein
MLNSYLIEHSNIIWINNKVKTIIIRLFDIVKNGK